MAEVPINPLLELVQSISEVHDRQVAEGGYEAGKNTVGYWRELAERALANDLARLPKVERAASSNKVSRALLDREITL